jgi:LDH2 family malate/lactate/ureidoglycolate dehydrogenase
VLLPGEPEAATRASRIEHGIALAPGTRDALDRLAAELDVPSLRPGGSIAPSRGDSEEPATP